MSAERRLIDWTEIDWDNLHPEQAGKILINWNHPRESWNEIETLSGPNTHELRALVVIARGNEDRSVPEVQELMRQRDGLSWKRRINY